MSDSVALNASHENAARSFNGYLMLLLMLISIGWFVWAMGPIIADDPNADFIGMAASIAVFPIYLRRFLHDPTQSGRRANPVPVPIRAPIAMKGCVGFGRG